MGTHERHRQLRCLRPHQDPADSAATANIDGRDIKVDVNPDLMAAMESGIPLGRGGMTGI